MKKLNKKMNIDPLQHCIAKIATHPYDHMEDLKIFTSITVGKPL